MSIHHLTLIAHPTVISPPGTTNPFEGWGVRIGR